MIIFYNRKTGKIAGTIDGRVHNEDHLRMWVGTKEENDRLIIDWSPTQWYDRNGKQVAKDAKDKKGNRLAFTADFMPNHPQKELFVEIEKQTVKLQDYQIDLKTKQLVKNEPERNIKNY